MAFFLEISTWIQKRFSWKSRKVTSRYGFYWAPRAFSAIVHWREVAYLVEKKIFRNFFFENFIFKIFFFIADSGRFFSWLWRKKKVCSTQNRFYARYRSKRQVESCRLTKFKKIWTRNESGKNARREGSRRPVLLYVSYITCTRNYLYNMRPAFIW